MLRTPVKEYMLNNTNFYKGTVFEDMDTFYEMNTAIPNGTVLLLAEGKYELDGHLNIRGVDGLTIRPEVPGSEVILESNSTDGIVIQLAGGNVNNVLIEGLTLIAKNSSSSKHNHGMINVRNNTDGNENIFIRDNKFAMSSSHAISIWNPNDIGDDSQKRVTNVNIYENTFENIGLNGSSGWPKISKNAIHLFNIDGASIHHNDFVNVAGSAILLDHVRNADIHDNTARNILSFATVGQEYDADVMIRDNMAIGPSDSLRTFSAGIPRFNHTMAVSVWAAGGVDMYGNNFYGFDTGFLISHLPHPTEPKYKKDAYYDPARATASAYKNTFTQGKDYTLINLVPDYKMPAILNYYGHKDVRVNSDAIPIFKGSFAYSPWFIDSGLTRLYDTGESAAPLP